MPSYASRIDLRHLRYFVSIVRCGSFRAAAEELNISQPPLTRQIQQLEQVLGAVLLHRGTGGVTTTEAGAAFYTEAENILGLFEQACESASLIGSGLLGRLDVAVFGSAILDIVPRIVLAFRQRYPQVEVILHNMDRESQIKALQERRILIGFNRFFVDHPNLHWEPVVHETMLVAAPSDHPLAARSRISLRDLANEPLIFYPRTGGTGGFSNYLLRLFHNLDIEPKVVQNVDDVVAAIAFVSSGLGLTLGVDSARNLQLPGVTYIELEEGESSAFDLSVIYRAGEHSQLLDAFLDSVRAVSGNVRPGD
jgi:molybdate transport repressor ModE-like protein